jgi:hypothetical protein
LPDAPLGHSLVDRLCAHPRHQLAASLLYSQSTRNTFDIAEYIVQTFRFDDKERKLQPKRLDDFSCPGTVSDVSISLVRAASPLIYQH